KGTEFSLSFSFEHLGTHEEIVSDLDGVPLIYPVDETDTMEWLRPAIERFLKQRQALASEEAQGLREVLGSAQSRSLITERVRKLLGRDQFSAGIDEAYDRALGEIDALLRDWEIWSGSLHHFHLYNAATMAPFEKGPGQIEFDEIHLAKQDEGFGITLHPPFVRPGIGRGSFDPKAPPADALRLDLFNATGPGHSAEANALDMERFLNSVAEVLGKLAIEGTLEIAQTHLFESLLRQEIEASILSPQAPPVLIQALARYHLILQRIVLKRGSPELMSDLARTIVFPLPSDSAKSEALIDRLEKADPLAVTDSALVEGASRILAWAWIQHGQSDPDGTPLLSLLSKKGIAIPKGGFDRAAFEAGLESAYPDWKSAIAPARAEVLGLAKMIGKEQSGGAPEPKPQTPFHRFNNRTTKTIDGYTFTYPNGLDRAVETIAPEWIAELREAERVLHDRFGDLDSPVPPVELDDACLEGIRALGLKVNREMANTASDLVSAGANAFHYAKPFIANRGIQIHLKSELMALLKGGANLENFSLSDGGTKVSFDFNLKIPGKVSQPAPSPKMPALPVVVAFEGDFFSASLDDQVNALRDGAGFIDTAPDRAQDATPEPSAQNHPTVLTNAQSWFLAVHELTEGALVLQVIASPDRRWFCDGLANAVAIRECDRRFGPGEGHRTFESLFPPEACQALASQVNLMQWKALEIGPDSVTELKGLDPAHYYFATL
ncbi:MAG: hypothetical protein KDM64_12655, partial [Verrucomicrobiae bacterium]|nr:hypothetical protein [Verrucomicrobiae bacterium]